MGLLIEKYIGKTGLKLFLLFCWLFTLIVIAAFADMVAGTFNAYTVTEEGTTVLAELANVNGAAGSISLFFMGFAVVFGLLQKKFNLDGWKEVVLGLLFTFASLALGMNLPLVAGKLSLIHISSNHLMNPKKPSSSQISLKKTKAFKSSALPLLLLTRSLSASQSLSLIHISLPDPSRFPGKGRRLRADASALLRQSSGKNTARCV